jgi:hypothetical protein
LIRDLPRRVTRLPSALAAGGSASQAGALSAYLWDLAGGPEVFSLLWRFFTRTSALTQEELASAVEILGEQAIRFGDVRVAEGGVLGPIFRRNGGRAFTTYHTVNLPGRARAGRTLAGLVVHELVHVLQHERLGSVYIGQCLRAQRREGYDYGGAAGLQAACEQGKHLCDFNREQQAQIAEDYYNGSRQGHDMTAYEPFIEELRAGAI